jgi:aminodeoxyfutalosine deaminase
MRAAPKPTRRREEKTVVPGPLAGEQWSLTARWVLPVDGPPVEGGCVIIHGDRITAVEEPGRRTADVDLGDVAVLPGFVNAHTHLDLTGLRGLAPPTPDFTGWLRQVIAHRRSRSAELVLDDVQRGLSESLQSGTTLLGDISADGGSWTALAAAPLRAVVFRELLGLTVERSALVMVDALRWAHNLPRADTCRPALSPHAPYSVNAALIRSVGRNRMLATIHLAETLAEIELLDRHTGLFVPFLQDLGVWKPANLAPSVDWVLQRLSRVPNVLIAHGNYLAPDAPIPRNCSVIYCPRTHAAFGHAPHPFRHFLARGIRVALGTDSLASNPDLSVLNEARFLHQHHPDVPGERLLHIATLAGAEALGWHAETGSLTPGKSADLVAVPLPPGDTADPHRLVFESDLPVRAVLFRGRWLGNQGGTGP